LPSKIRADEDYMKNKVPSAADSLKMVLESLDHGFFVFDRSGVIQAEVSSAARRLFEHELTSASFFDILRLDAPEKENAKAWLELCFDAQLDFENFLPLAPQLFERDGLKIGLSYAPVFDSSGQLEKVACFSSDKTEELGFKKKAEAEFTLVQVVMAAVSDRAGFVAFVLEARRAFAELFAELESPAPRLDAMFRLIHSIKGSLAAYYFTEGSKTAHAIETNLSNLKSASPEKFAEYLPEVRESLQGIFKGFEGFLQEHEAAIGETKVATDRMKNLKVETIYEMSRRLSQELGAGSKIFQQFTELFVQDDVTSLFQRYENVAKGIAERQDKRLEFVVSPSEIHVISEPYLPMVGAYVHVFRNAVDHGIETPDTRVANGKPEHGTITMSFHARGGTLRIEVADDGKGIDAGLVRRKAIEKGVGPAAALNAMSDDQIVQLLFHTGFSTRDEVSDLSGRGVGLDAVQYEVERLGGRVWIETRTGIGSKVITEIPLIKSLEESRAKAA
jgi:two-component system chemotaxis sensor kinase CheA